MNLPPQRCPADELLRVHEALYGPAAIQIVCQPILELSTGRLAGYEALSRFALEPHVGPDEWFAMAHRHGLGEALEAKALAAALALPARPVGTWLSVNLSPSSLHSNAVLEVLDRDLHGVVLEITENQPLYSRPAVLRVLDALRRRGARIALDDLGTGFASTPVIPAIRPDLLKLDRRVVTGVSRDVRRAARIAAFVSLARTVGASVCAEGIEDVAELLSLVPLGVTTAQGYGIAQPAPPWGGISTAAGDVCAGFPPDLMTTFSASRESSAPADGLLAPRQTARRYRRPSSEPGRQRVLAPAHRSEVRRPWRPFRET